MLIGIDPLLSGELLAILRRMGHGETLCLADCNFPAHGLGPPSVRLDADLLTAGRAILSVFPLDGFVPTPIQRMEVVGAPDEPTPTQASFKAMVDEVAGPGWAMGSLERFAFYEVAKRASAVVATLDRAGYSCILLTKGVLGPDGRNWRPASAV